MRVKYTSCLLCCVWLVKAQAAFSTQCVPHLAAVNEETDNVQFQKAAMQYDYERKLYYFGESLSDLSKAENTVLPTIESAQTISYSLDIHNEDPVLLYDSGRKSFTPTIAAVGGTIAGGIAGFIGSSILGSMLFKSNTPQKGSSFLGAFAAGFLGGRLTYDYVSQGRRAYREHTGENLLVEVDRRTLVSEDTAKAWPDRVHGHVLMKYTDGQKDSWYIGSGTLVGSSYVLTAAHNLYDHATGRTPTEVSFYPGKAGLKVPWSARAEKLILHPQYKNSRALIDIKESDIGVIKLDKNLGNRLGYFGLRVLGDDDRIIVNVSGYPGSPGNGNFMYTSYGPIHELTANRIFYDVDTSGGQSGSGVWVKSNAQEYHCVAAHTYGSDRNKPWPEDTNNSGTRINQDNIALIQEWLTQ